MINLHKKNKAIEDLLKNRNLTTKIKIYFSTKVVGDDYDSYEKNYTTTSLNPLTILGYVNDIAPESLVWRGYGFKEMGAKKIICSDRYAEWFRKANEIEIDGDKYTPYRDAPGSLAVITQLPLKRISVVIFKK